MPATSHHQLDQRPLLASLLYLLAALLPSCGSSPADSQWRSITCGRIHLNHVHSPETGDLITDQLLFEDWHYERGEYLIEGWLLVKHCRPAVTRHGNEWRVRWLSQRGEVTVTAKHFTESHTDFDPETATRYDPDHPRRLLHLAGNTRCGSR